MKKHSIAILILFLLFSLRFASAASDSIIIGQEVTGTCNNNNICEANLGEDSNSCLVDCPLPTPTPVPPGGGGGGFIPDVSPPAIQSLSIAEVTFNSAKILWKTNELAACQLFLGNTEEYEKESISEASFYTDHSVSLRNLLPDTAYYFKIICSDTNRNKSESADKLVSLSLLDTTSPVNTGDFKAIAGDSEIFLSWQNPEDADFQSVKLFRSETFFPKSPKDGLLVYEGQKINFTDTHLENDKKYYYTIFAFDFTGNFSSGALASAVPRKKPVTKVVTAVPTGYISPTATITPIEEVASPKGTLAPTAIPIEITPVITPLITAVPTTTITGIPSKLGQLNLKDFVFSQEGAMINYAGEKIELDFEKPVTVSIDADKIPDEAGTIMLILSRGDETFSFLLKANAEKTKYESVIKLQKDTAFLLTITILDKNNNVLKAITGQMVSIQKETVPEEFQWQRNLLFLLILLLIFILLKKYFTRKTHKDNI